MYFIPEAELHNVSQKINQNIKLVKGFMMVHVLVISDFL